MFFSSSFRRTLSIFSSSSEEISIIVFKNLSQLERHPRGFNFKLTQANVHRLLLSALVLAAKFYDDIYYSNQHYAKVGGVSHKEIDLLEYQMLCLLQ